MYKKSNKRMIQSQNTKQLLYDHATRLFKEKGYYNVSIEEITKSAGVSVGAFYHHFASKDDIVLLWADHLDKEYSDFYTKMQLESKYEDVLYKIKSMILYSIEIYSFLGREFTTVSYSYMMKEPKACSRMVNPERSFYKIMKELVEKGKSEGVIIKTISTEQMVKDIVMVGRGAILDWCINGGNQNITERSTTFVNSYINGIKTR